RGRLQLHAAAGGPVRLAQHERHRETGGQQALPRDTGELGRAREEQAHADYASSRRALSILVLMRLRLRGDRYSTNRLPSKWSISCWMHTASVPSASISREWPSPSRARSLTAVDRATPS